MRHYTTLNTTSRTVRKNEFVINPEATNIPERALNFYRLASGQVVISEYQRNHDPNINQHSSLMFQTKWKGVDRWEWNRKVSSATKVRPKSFVAAKTEAVIWKTNHRGNIVRVLAKIVIPV